MYAKLTCIPPAGICAALALLCFMVIHALGAEHSAVANTYHAVWSFASPTCVLATVCCIYMRYGHRLLYVYFRVNTLG